MHSIHFVMERYYWNFVLCFVGALYTLSRTVNGFDPAAVVRFSLADINCTDKEVELCETCEAGSFANDSVTECDCCKTHGKSGQCVGLQLCTKCTPGYYQPKPGQLSCEECPVGEISIKSGSTQCTKCPAGSCSGQPGSDACTLCHSGTYSEEGAGECSLCPSGHFCSTTNCSACLPCAGGTYMNHTAGEACDKCPSGYFSDSGAATCMECPAGHYSPAPGSAQCLPCEPGHFSADTASTKCNPCEPGTKQERPGQPHCLDCERGSYCNVTACTKCFFCEAGMEARNTTSCTDCSVCFYKRNNNTNFCSMCDPGFFNTQPHSKVPCDPCPPDNYCEPMTCEPRPCTADMYCPPGSAEPIACHRPWFRKTMTSCDKTAAFYGVLSAVVMVPVLVAALIGGFCAYERYRRQHPEIANERTRLVHSNPQGTESRQEPSYTGL